MKHKFLKIIPYFSAILLLSACAQTTQTQTEQTPEESQVNQESQVQKETEGQEEVQESAEIMTMEQLEQLREEGAVDYVLSDQGYVTWLTGNYYDGEIKGEAEVMEALSYMRNVLGMGEDARFLKGTAVMDDNGFTYYTVRQFSGGNTVQFAIAKVITDSDGRAVALSSSIQPGVEAAMDTMIPQEEALEVVGGYLKENNPDAEYKFYPDSVGKTILSYGTPGEGGYAAAYVVYTSNPEASAETTDMYYLAHYVGSDGNYLYHIPVCSIGDEYAESGSDADTYFQGKEETVYTGEVTLHDGSKKELTVPVLYDQDEDTYYLADAERKIAMMDHFAFTYEENVEIRSTSDNKGWDDKDLITYDNYCKIYDFFADMGCYSTDGLGTPVAILSDCKDENGEQIPAANYSGKVRGWQVFETSPLNDYGECIDAMAHEYTHGFNFASFTDFLYAGEYGAINEGYSDIIGNLVQRLCSDEQDPEWQLAETIGEPIRSMSNPNDFGQPGFVGDAFYVPMNLEPTPFNDYAGVHVNNSLLSMVAVDLDKKGMTPEEQQRLWITASCAMTPLTGFKELFPILTHAAEISGLGQWKDSIVESFENRGLTQDFNNITWPDVEGCGKIRFSLDASDRYEALCVMILDPETGSPQYTWVTSPDDENVVEIQYPEGDYLLGLRVLDYENPQAPKRCIYMEDGWKFPEEDSIPRVVTVEYGKLNEVEKVVWP